MMGIVAGIMGLLAPLSVKKFNRRSIIVNGYFMISITHALLAFFIQIG